MHSFWEWLDARTDYRQLLAPLRRRVLPSGPRWSYSSGSCLLWLFVIQLVTGLLLMMTYSPSITSAWASVHFIEQSSAGAFLRGVHYFASHALIILFAIHVVRVLWSGAFRAPRELIWVTGLLLLPLMLVWAVTGNPLSASQKGMSQIEVEGNILGSTPLIGPLIQRILIGGDEVGQLTLTHLYFLHVALLPILVIGLLAVHISQVYRHGLAPLESGSGQRAKPYWPYQTIRNMTVLSLIVGTIAVLAGRWGAPLDAPADPNLAHVPRPEWYFRCLFELRRYFTGDWEFVATLVLPVVVMLFFVMLPIIDRWCSRRFSGALRLVVVVVGLGGWGWLTGLSFTRDWHDVDYVAALAKSAELGQRARELADRNEMSSAGAIALLREDPRSQGPLLFEKHCASCHSHVDENGRGITATEPSAPNLHGFGTAGWIAGMLDPERIVSSHYFGNTKFADGEMASKLQEMFEETEDDKSGLREQLVSVSCALAAEAALPPHDAIDPRDAETIAVGAKLMAGDFSCTDCHRFHDAGDLGSAPDLTGYGSREWLLGMIGDPRGDRFYGPDHNDRMPSFAADAQHPESNLLNSRELSLLVDWLRGQWYESDRRSTERGANSR